jgi:D-alanyl-D-alanine carboxypeptidase
MRPVFRYFNGPVAAPPTTSATANYTVDLETQRTLYAVNENSTTHQLGSIAKLMTAILITENVPDPSGTFYTASTTDVTFSGSFQLPLEDGDVVSVTDLMHGMIMPSANDAAQTLGRSYGDAIDGGGKASFVTAMNSRARQLGMIASTFLDPQGSGSKASPKDVVTMMEHVLTLPSLVSIMRTTQYVMTISGARSTTITIGNINPLLSTSPITVYAGKTGDPGTGEFQYVVAWDSTGGNRVISCNMGGSSAARKTDMQHVLRGVTNDYWWDQSDIPQYNKAVASKTGTVSVTFAGTVA